jgi:ribonuclease HI
MSKIYINTDGGSRGNPGPMAIGIVFSDAQEKVIHEYKKFIGEGTNNEAEYEAIICALEILHKNDWLKGDNGDVSEVICRLDSQLVVEQIKGNYKIKQPHLQLLVERVKNILNELDFEVIFTHIRREENKLADKLVNEALDEATKSEKDSGYHR